MMQRFNVEGSVMKMWPVSVAVAICASALADDPYIGDPIRVDRAPSGKTVNETTAVASEDNFLRVVAGWNDGRLWDGTDETVRVGFNLSDDGGATWGNPDYIIRPADEEFQLGEFDPMTAADVDGYLWVGAVAGYEATYVARLDPGNVDFEDAVIAQEASSSDKGWMAGGPPPGTGSTRQYISQHKGLAWSNSLGDDWTSGASLALGAAYLPRVGPDGTLYVARLHRYGFPTQGDYFVQRSTDGGVTFDDDLFIGGPLMTHWNPQGSCPSIPGGFRVPQFVYFAVDTNVGGNYEGALYALYMDVTSSQGGNDDVDLYFTKSDDDGDNWDEPEPIELDGDQFFPWIEVDRFGRIHVVFMDTRDVAQDDSDSDAWIHYYYMYSSDQGANWNEYRLTDEPWNSSDDGWTGGQFIGDYIGMAVAGNRVYAVYPYTPDDDPEEVDDPDIYASVIVFPEDCTADCDGSYDGRIDILDLLAVLGQWESTGTSCDVGGDGVGINELLAVLGQWGFCFDVPAEDPPSVYEEAAAAGLSSEDWDTLEDCAVNGTAEERENCICWIDHYLTCHTTRFCIEVSGGPCPDDDPLGNH